MSFPPDVIHFSIPGEPIPWARARGGKSTHRFTPDKQRNYMGVIKLYCQNAMRGTDIFPVEPLELRVIAVYGYPKSWSKKRRRSEWKITRPDADNISKLVKDALNGVAWADDSQVASLIVRKIYGPVPRLMISIIPLTAAAEVRA